MGSGFDTVDSAVASNTSGRRFESSHVLMTFNCFLNGPSPASFCLFSFF